MTVVGEIKGLGDLTKMLEALPDKVRQGKILVIGLKEGGKVIRSQAQANLIANDSVDTGLLESTMVVAEQKQAIPGLAEVAVRPSSKLSMVIRKGQSKATRARPSKYAHFVEKGTEHAAAKPFMRPAFDEKREEAVQKITESVQAGVAAEAEKLGLKVK